MFAITEIAGHQYKVNKGKKIYVHRLANKIGEKVEFDRVLLWQSGEIIKVGTPTIKGAKVTAEVLDHVKGDKVKVFKKKRRKGYKKMQGHRQQFSLIRITEI